MLFRSGGCVLLGWRELGKEIGQEGCRKLVGNIEKLRGRSVKETSARTFVPLTSDPRTLISGHLFPRDICSPRTFVPLRHLFPWDICSPLHLFPGHLIPATSVPRTCVPRTFDPRDICSPLTSESVGIILC